MVAIGTTFVGNFLYQQGVLVIGAQSASIISTLEPIVSIIVGAILFRERIGITGIIGAVLIITAAIVVTRIESKE